MRPSEPAANRSSKSSSQPKAKNWSAGDKCRPQTDKADIGPTAKAGEPHIEQLVIAAAKGLSGDAFERQLYLIRKQASHRLRGDTSLAQAKMFYVCSLSTKVIIYKGMLTTEQLFKYFPDLASPDYTSHLAMVHSRFSTNTFPSWDRAQPMRFMSHNGEINTLRGNMNWMQARAGRASKASCSARKLSKLFPVAEPDCSDSGTFDNVLEFLLMTGRTLQESVMMMIPEAWQNHETMSEDKQAFYEYHSCLMEPWDGPASIVFTDGKYIGAVLDRNGLRPSRYYITHDDRVIMASEVGVLFVLVIIMLFRLGCQVPAPGVNVANVQSCLAHLRRARIYSLINLFSGGALLQLTIFALGIMPYITASIILQLLVVVIPRLEALKKEGQSGQTRSPSTPATSRSVSRVLQATGIVALARVRQPPPGLRPEPAPQRRHLDLPGHGHHHDRRHGRDHVARRADHRARHRQRHVDPDLHPGRRDLPGLAVGRAEDARAGGSSAIVMAIGLVIIAAVIFIEQAQRRIPVQYARRMVGPQDVRRLARRTSRSRSTRPASSRSSSPRRCSTCPAMAVQFNQTATRRASSWINDYLVSGDHPLYMAIVLRR